MSLDRRIQAQVNRLKKMGKALSSLAALCSGITYLLPHDETIYWLSSNGKQGTYVLSAFFLFLGLYCLRAIWRRRNFF